MKNPSNKYIEDILREKIRKDDKLVDVIIDTLSIGKESAYRRLRGEVPYTFDDVMKISAKFNISLDSIVGNRRKGAALVNTSIIDIEDPIESYKNYLVTQREIFKELGKRENPKAYLAFNLIPYAFYSSYRVLTRFRLYRWFHQMNNTGNQLLFKDLDLSEDLWSMHKEMIKEFSLLPEIHFIFDTKLFLKLVKDIRLFVQLELIDRESLLLLKKELLQLLDDIEQMTKFSSDSEIKRSIYISNVSFETSYLYFEADDYHICSLRLLGISVISTQDEWICKQQKRWIESLKRYSTLVSVSGEINRLAFINQQKEYINEIDTPVN